jgi:hypothetical protein
MITEFPKTGLSHELIDATAAYLVARAAAETMREAVDEIATDVLTRVELYNDLAVRHERDERRRITEPRYTYLSEDEEATKAYFAECDKAERAAGLKPAEMPNEHCPALVAEHEQAKAEWALIDAAATFLQMDNPLDFKKHLFGEKRQRFIDLTASMVLSYEGGK